MTGMHTVEYQTKKESKIRIEVRMTKLMEVSTHLRQTGEHNSFYGLR